MEERNTIINQPDFWIGMCTRWFQTLMTSLTHPPTDYEKKYSTDYEKNIATLSRTLDNTWPRGDLHRHHEPVSRGERQEWHIYNKYNNVGQYNHYTCTRYINS